MFFEKPTEGGARVEDLGTELRVTIRGRLRPVVLLFMTGWLALWTYGGVRIGQQALDGEGNQLFTIVWLCFWVYGEGYALAVLMWMFVLSRVVHAAIHVTSNKLSYRTPMFLIGAIALALIWVIVIARIVLFQSLS